MSYRAAFHLISATLLATGRLCCSSSSTAPKPHFAFACLTSRQHVVVELTYSIGQQNKHVPGTFYVLLFGITFSAQAAGRVLHDHHVNC